MTGSGEISARDRALKVDAILRDALELDTQEERYTYVTNACADRPDVRAEVLALLAADAESEAALDSALQQRDSLIQNAFDSADESESASHLIGSAIGNYRIVQLIARGGMGAVYLAERADGQFQQVVAIKILPTWAADQQTVARLRVERQILSTLQHPNITQLLSGGETPDGIPYLVTEYIDGVPLTDFVDDNDLPLDARLDLFVELADAVHYAHTKLVVHRDIKPSNVLVDRAGRPHLLDFGIAKLIEPDAIEMTALHTAVGFSPMTLQYASPEQLANESVTTASDVYQLGILLYRIITGQLPEASNGSNARLPARPSHVVNKKASGRWKDLDTIVLKALRPDPADRYASAAEFAGDIRRFLSGRAIVARNESAIETLRRLAIRNPFGAASVAIIVGLLIFWGASMQVYTKRVAAERDFATQQAARAARVKEVLTDIYRRQDPLQRDTVAGGTSTLWDSLDAAVERVAGQLVDEPDIQAELYTMFASLYLGAGRVPDAIEVTRRAESIYTRLGDAWIAQLAASKADLAGLLMNTNGNESQAMLDDALALTADFEHEDPATAVSIMLQAGYLMHESANRPLAIEYFSNAQRIVDEYGLDNASQQIEILFGLGNALVAEDRLSEAEPLLLRALQLAEEKFGNTHARLNGVLSALSSLERYRGNLDLAVMYSNRVVASMRQSRSENYENLLTARNNLALALAKAGEYEQATAILEEVVAIRRDMAPVGGSANLATSVKNLATVQHMAGDYAAALENALESLPLIEQNLPAGSAYQATPHFTLSLIYLDTDEPAKAEAAARRSLELLLPIIGEDHYQVAVNRCVIGEALLNQGRYEESSNYLGPALDALLAAETSVPRYEKRCQLAFERSQAVR